MAELTSLATLSGIVKHKYFQTKEAYNNATKSGSVVDTDICFIVSEGAIYTHGQAFGEGSNVLTALTEHQQNYSNPHKVTASQIGLGNVENTADMDKPVSTAQKTALDNKVDKVTGKSLVSDDQITKLAALKTQTEITADITAAKTAALDAVKVHESRTDNPHSVTAEQVGLGNLTNEKQIPLTQKGVAGGVATLGTDGLIPSSQLPSYVDDVLEYTSKTALDKVTGETGKIYVTTDDNKTYRWSGSAYVEISASLALGETSSTAYAGDKGAQLASDLTALTATVATNTAAIAKKVDAETGKGLSTNDYTTTEKNKLAGIEAKAQVNVLESVKVNGTAVTITNKAVDITVPTKLSALTNDGNYVVDASYVHTDKNFTASYATKLDGIATGAQVNILEKVQLNGTDIEVSNKVSNIVVNKSTVGLGNVDNTSDANKPISTAQAAQFNTIIDAYNSLVASLTWTEAE